jgi:hypothetical protein
LNNEAPPNPAAAPKAAPDLNTDRRVSSDPPFLGMFILPSWPDWAVFSCHETRHDTGHGDLLAGCTCRNAPALSSQTILNDNLKFKCLILAFVSFCSNFADFNALAGFFGWFRVLKALSRPIKMLLSMPICI